MDIKYYSTIESYPTKLIMYNLFTATKQENETLLQKQLRINHTEPVREELCH